MIDEYFMKEALQQAKLAAQEDEIPVGACLVKGSQILLSEHNRTKQNHNPLHHAEKLILDKAQEMGLKFLQDCTLYITLEPCLMCSGMIILCRVGRIVFGCSDPKAGAVGSIYNCLWDKSFNHHPQITRGVLAAECAFVLTDFFQKKR